MDSDGNLPVARYRKDSEIDAIDISDREGKSWNRGVLAQVLAVSCINFILLDLGMVLALPTIVIPDLVKSGNGLMISEEQASWLGSLAFIFQPLGSALSGLTFEPVGRRTTMLWINVPLIVGWVLIRCSTKIGHLYVAQIIMGMSIGLMDAPHITYLGEITQPRWRGIFISFAELCVALGFCIVYFLGCITDWRTVSTVCCSVPVASILLISRIPESPIWLLSKGKSEESLKSLCWLRGWVDPKCVSEEFENLERDLNDKKNGKSQWKSGSIRRTDNANFKNKLVSAFGLRDIFRKAILQPLFVVATYFAFSHTAGVTNTRPYMVEILNEFGSSMAPVQVTAISSVASMLGFVIGMVLVSKTGKRFLSMTSMFGCALLNALIGCYGFLKRDLQKPWIPCCLFVHLNFIWSCGIGQVPWMLISEVFPFRGRGIASGIVAALSYVEAFVVIKSYYSLHNSLSISGVFFLYAFCSFLGGIFLYFFLPETEGKTLHEIETVFETHFTNIFFLRTKN